MSDEEVLVINIMPSEMTIREVVDLEDAAGVSIHRVLANYSKREPIARELAAWAWIVKRREDPSFTFEQALEANYGDITFSGGEEDGPPDQAAEGGSGEKQ